ncbi:hypothetical protein Tco_0912200 [Tanacetum coccineum]
MATPGARNQVTRRLMDDLIDFSGETSVQGYMKFFKAQQLVKTRRFVNRIRQEAQTARNLIVQLNALITEMEALEDQGEVFDTLMGLRYDRRVEDTKLIGLNDLITQAKEEIEIKEAQLESYILVLERLGDWLFPSFMHSYEVQKFLAVFGTGFGLIFGTWLDVRLVMSIRMWGAGNVLTMAALYILDKLTEIADSSLLQDKMKVVFSRARSEDESFIRLMRDLCSGLREMVVCDSAMLGVLEQLLAGTHVGMRLKAGYVADMEETK